MHWMSILVLACGVGFASGKIAAAESDISVGPLLAKYAELGEQLRNNPFQRALYLESSQSRTHLKGEIYAVVDYPFDIVNGALNNPAHWCDVLILHINVKYCNASRREDGTVLTVNIGRKYFQELEDVYRLDFNYRAVITTPEYFALELNADKGPLSTHDYRIWIEAAALEDGRTFLHVTYAYEFGLIGRLAMGVYLATIGRDKVGFTVTEILPDGQPVYIRGVRGVVERNTMRYYLAIDAYFDALITSPEDQLEQRLQKWYHSADQYARQLHEVERDDYLDMKRREDQRQQLAQ
jgi:SAM-dependent methyltransferase